MEQISSFIENLTNLVDFDVSDNKELSVLPEDMS